MEEFLRKARVLLRETKRVFADCATKSGGILAANPAKPYYPRGAANYGYVWVRDASFVCVAADVLELGIQEKFFEWCMRAERFPGTTLFCRRYHPDGTALAAGEGLGGEIENQLQPDQAGALLWALWHHFREDPSEARDFRPLIREVADGLCELWKKNRFDMVVFDVWEEQAAFPDLDEFFSYTLAACAGGLRYAGALFPNPRWQKTADQMVSILRRTPGKRFFRSYGRIPDPEVDASLLGLVFPFEVFSHAHPKIRRTIADIEKELVIGGGLHRYPGDRYDGWVYEGKMLRQKGGGAWPLLNFWLSVCHARAGNKRRALRYARWVLRRVNRHIPEQIFPNRLQVSPSPLAWAHAMFVLAMRELRIV